jgi:ABC-type molybdate transport system substrate-binding protein
MFEKADKLKAGSFRTLDAKALKLVGAADSPQPPAGRNTYGWLMADKKADLFITYCTNAILATREVPGLQMVSMPEALAVGAEYGLTVLKGARTDAGFLALYILSPAGQQILARHGFTAVALPMPGS